jgi:trigger factor
MCRKACGFKSLLPHLLKSLPRDITLKIETQNREDNQIQITAESDSTTFESFKLKAARKIARETKIPGFRPGKAPFAVIRRIHGDELIKKQAIEMMIDDKYPEIISEAQVKPYGPGTLEKIISEDPPKFQFLVPLEPSVKIEDFHNIRQEYTPPEIMDKDVEEYLSRVRKAYATAEPVDRAAKKGDLVYLKIKGTAINPVSNQNEELIKETPLQILVEDPSSGENDFPFKGFDKILIGLKTNEEKNVDYTYPPDSLDKKMSGKTVNFSLSIQSIKVMKLPEVNDEFAKLVGGFENSEGLRNGIRKQLEANAKNEYERKYFDEIIESIRKDTVIKYPPQALDDEVEHVLNSIRNDLATQKLDLETYLKTINKDKNTFLAEEVKPVAVKRLEQSLIFEEIAKKENIKLDEKELKEAFSQTVQELQVTNDFQKIKRKISPQRLSNAIAIQTANRLMSNRVLERLKNIATGEFDKAKKKENQKRNDVEDIASNTSTQSISTHPSDVNKSNTA